MLGKEGRKDGEKLDYWYRYTGGTELKQRKTDSQKSTYPSLTEFGKTFDIVRQNGDDIDKVPEGVPTKKPLAQVRVDNEFYYQLDCK